jgi:opacity protein-like surface antigen
VKRLIIATFLGAAALTAPVASSSAQDFNPFEIGGALGAAVPMGDLDDVADVGYNATFILGYKPAFSPLGFRFDAAYNQFGFESGGGDVELPSFTGNVVLDIPTGGFSPYLIGGAGLYRIPSSLTIGPDAENKFGFNAGGGISMRLSGFKVFVEARYNHVKVDDAFTASFIPITFGAIF